MTRQNDLDILTAALGWTDAPDLNDRQNARALNRLLDVLTVGRPAIGLFLDRAADLHPELADAVREWGRPMADGGSRFLRLGCGRLLTLQWQYGRVEVAYIGA